MSKNPTSATTLSPREKLLNSPVHILPISPDSSDRLVKMGFKTIREAFRAALVGRLYTRKLGGADFENSILEAGCTILNHPVFNRNDLKDFPPLDSEKCFADVLSRFSGYAINLQHPFMSRPIRDILLPSTIHNALQEHGIKTLHDLVSLPLDNLPEIEGTADITLGPLLCHIFDYIFILNNQIFDGESNGNPVHWEEEPEIGVHHSGPPVNSSWFSEELLAKGLEYLTQHRPQAFFFFRNVTGVIFQENDSQVESSVLLAVSAPPRNSHDPLEITDSACSLCSPLSKRNKNCFHIAALAQFLTTPNGSTESDHLHRMFSFPESPWFVIGQILFDMFGQGHDCGLSTSYHRHDRQLSVPGPADLPYAKWELSEQTAGLVATLYEKHCSWDPPPSSTPTKQTVVDLHRRLFEKGRSQTEVELNILDKRTLNQDRDESVWMWLARRMCVTTPAENINLEGPGEAGLFTFRSFDGKRNGESFAMTIPRAKMADLLDGFALYGRNDLLLPTAKAITKVNMADDGSIIVSPQIVLQDGRTLNRGALEKHKYGRYYFLEGEGFLPVSEQNPKNTITGKGNLPRKIKSDNVPKTLEKYQQALHAVENDIDPLLKELKVQETPDSLQINSFDSDTDWCYLAGHYGLGNRRIALTELMAARSENRNYLPTERTWLKLNDSSLSWFHELGDERKWADKHTGETGIRLTRREMLLLTAIIPDLQIQESARGKDLLAQLLQTDRWIENDALDGMPEHLRDYQKHGIAWLNQIYTNQLTGILADDMGLGKTHQALGLLSILIEKSSTDRKYLVICPATVIPHWAEKIRNFFPELSFYIYHGSRRNLDKGKDCKIIITTYGIIRRDTKSLEAADFDLIIFDEIQQIKNKKTDAHKAATALKCKVSLGLTGTPLENSVQDLKAIFDICMPGYLGSDHDFRTRYALPIEEDNNPEAKETLARIINPFLLRRTREQVLTELPSVIEDIRTCQLSNDQVSLYREIVSGRGQHILDSFEETENSTLPYMELLAVINYLKQVCDHPCLIKKCTDPKRFKSGKWDLFIELLDECLASEMKVVVFSHYTRMLDIIERHMEQNGIVFCRLRGDMPIGKRHEMIHKFNHDGAYKVFSASLLAGGVGVDLTAAQAVIHYDRWWNAAREDQATARVHRMGQKNVVQVFKLITEGTLEEKIHTIISRKKELANHMVREDDSAIIKRFSKEELLEILSIPAGN